MSLLGRIEKLEKALKSRWIIDSEDIIAEDTGLGIALYLEDSFEDDSEESDAYKGFFKIIESGENTYGIVDGAVHDSVVCGYVNAGNTRIAVNTPDEISAAGDGAFYIETTYVSPDYVSVIKFAAILPDAVNGKDICLIGGIIDGEIIQRLYGEHTIVRWV